MQHSSKKNPCPICQRIKDDKCRWDEEFILCYFGDEYAPPNKLSLGDTVKVDGLDWALVKTTAGFSGGSYCFVRHRPLFNAAGLSTQERERELKRKITCAQGAEIAFSDLRKIYQKCLGMPEPESMRLDEINFYKRISLKANMRARKLRRFISRNKRYVKRANYYSSALELWEKQSRYQLDGILYFERVYLGGDLF